MSKLIKCCNDGVNGIFESPTGSLLIRRSNPKIIVGTGKTLSILVSAISWQNKEKIVVADALAKQKLAATSKIGNDEKVKANPFFQTTFPTPLEKTGEKDPPRVPKIFIASRTQRQLEQMIRELKVKTKLNPKMAILGSRFFSLAITYSNSWLYKRSFMYSSRRSCKTQQKRGMFG